MLAWPQSPVTRDDTQLSLMLQRMPPTFRAFNKHRTTKRTLEESSHWFILLEGINIFTYCWLLLQVYQVYWDKQIEWAVFFWDNLSQNQSLLGMGTSRTCIWQETPYSSHEYKQFAAKYGFTYTTSSPCYLWSNREVERAVKTIKSLLKKNDTHTLHWWYMWLSEQKSDMFALKLKFIFLPQLIATLNNYACSLPPLANVTGLFSLNAFCRPCKSTNGEMVPKEGSRLAVGTWYGSHCQCTSV